MKATVEQRFWKKVLPALDDSGCQNWIGAKMHGYGSFSMNGNSILAHRYRYETDAGPIPNGLLVCHRCNNKSCVNLDHLYLADNAQNIRDAWRDGLCTAHNSTKERCTKCGSEYDHYNTQKRRYCRKCKNENWMANHWLKKIRASLDAAISDTQEEAKT